MLDNTKYAHFTVPHSGTRYINEAVRKATGHKPWQCASEAGYKRLKSRNDPRTSEEFLFCHLGQRWDDWIKMVVEQEHIKKWITVRCPINTWGTHYGHVWTNWKNGSPNYLQSAYEKLGQLRSQYDTLLEFAPRVEYIHRVDEDPLSHLGGYLGLELEEHDQTFSNPSPMKRALMERDLDKIEELCEFCPEFWYCFRDYVTQDFAPFFENLGYDIWWTNG